MKSNQELYGKMRKLEILMGRYYGHRGHGKGGHGHSSHRGQGRVLAMLSERKEISQKELGEALDMRKQSLGELLRKLESKGFIERKAAEDDRRLVIVRITDSGQEKAENIGRETEDKKDMFEIFSEEEKNSFESYIGRLIDELEKQWEQMPEEEQRQYRAHSEHHHHGCGHGSPDKEKHHHL